MLRIKQAASLLAVMAVLTMLLACAGVLDLFREEEESPEPRLALPSFVGIDVATNEAACCTGPGEIAITAIASESATLVDWSVNLGNNNLGATATPQSGQLGFGQRIDISVKIAACPEEGVVEDVPFTINFTAAGRDPLESIVPHQKTFKVRRCDARQRLLITVSQLTGLEGLGVIATGQQTFGSSAERIAVAANQTYGFIDVANGTTEVIDSGDTSHFGIVPLRAPSDPHSDVLIAFGETGIEVNSFVDDDGEFSPFVQFDPQNSTRVFDAVPYAGDADAVGVIVAREDRVESREFPSDPAVPGLADGSITIVGQAFVDAGGESVVVSAFSLSSTGPVLVATEGVPGTSNGQLFYWTADEPDALTLIGSTGDTPRRIRGIQIGDTWLLAVSNFGDSTLTLVRVEGTSMPTITGSVDLSGQPVGIDAMETTDGAAAFVATGFDTDTYSIVKVATDGSVVSNTSTDLDPAEVDAPGHAVWLSDGAIAISGNASNTVLIVPNMLP
jgi:hypothetical protein